jgi:hypothetical protein
MSQKSSEPGKRKKLITIEETNLDPEPEKPKKKIV